MIDLQHWINCGFDATLCSVCGRPTWRGQCLEWCYLPPDELKKKLESFWPRADWVEPVLNEAMCRKPDS